MAYQTLRQEYFQIPVVTRAYTTACVITTLSVHLEIVTPFQLYFNPTLILEHYQLWRLGTTFLFFGTFGFNFLFNMIFTYRYCRMLEEGSFRGRSADFIMMFFFGGILMIIAKEEEHRRSHHQITEEYRKDVMLGKGDKKDVADGTSIHNYAGIRLVSKESIHSYELFGILNFQAPYLPWVLLGFSVLIGNTIWVDLMGIVVGHIYYFLEDVFPDQVNGFHVIKTPQFLKNIFDEPIEDADYTALPEDRPGGFNWGREVDNNANEAQNNERRDGM